MSSNTKKCRVRFTVPEGDIEALSWDLSHLITSLSPSGTVNLTRHFLVFELI